jgi:GntR family histidine utilization transcriptional repressor
MTESPYQAIKRSIADGIASRRYSAGQVLPSEHELCRTFGVARMTVNRAMRELAAENLVRRVPGVGTFVAEPVAQSGLVELRNIADEIAERGHRHSAQVFALGTLVADEVAIQYEDRLVNPALAPDYLRQDFARMTPNEYLVQVAPVQEVAHTVQAVAAPPDIARHMGLAPSEPCLLVTRRTWSRDRLAAFTKLYYPGSRFVLTGRFVPSNR